MDSLTGAVGQVKPFAWANLHCLLQDNSPHWAREYVRNCHLHLSRVDNDDDKRCLHSTYQVFRFNRHMYLTARMVWNVRQCKKKKTLVVFHSRIEIVGVIIKGWPCWGCQYFNLLLLALYCSQRLFKVSFFSDIQRYSLCFNTLDCENHKDKSSLIRV